jgi:hypothetical protein
MRSCTPRTDVLTHPHSIPSQFCAPVIMLYGWQIPGSMPFCSSTVTVASEVRNFSDASAVPRPWQAGGERAERFRPILDELVALPADAVAAALNARNLPSADLKRGR